MAEQFFNCKLIKLKKVRMELVRVYSLLLNETTFGLTICFMGLTCDVFAFNKLVLDAFGRLEFKEFLFSVAGC